MSGVRQNYIFRISLLDKRSQLRLPYTADLLGLAHQTGDTELNFYLMPLSLHESPLDMPVLPSLWCRFTCWGVILWAFENYACATGHLSKSNWSLRKLVSLLHTFSSGVPFNPIPLTSDSSHTPPLYSCLSTKEKHSKETSKQTVPSCPNKHKNDWK